MNMRIQREGKTPIRGILDTDGIWLFYGEVLFKLDKINGCWSRIMRIPDLLADERIFEFDMLKKNHKILLFPRYINGVCIVDVEEDNFHWIIDDRMAGDHYVSAGSSEKIWIIPRKNDFFLLESDYSFRHMPELNKKIFKELERQNLHFVGFSAHGSYAWNNELVITVATKEKDLFFVLDEERFIIRRIIAPDGVGGKYVSVMYENGFLWFQNIKGEDSSVIKLSVSDGMVYEKWDLPKEYGNRVFFRHRDGSVLVISRKGCVGVIDLKTNNFTTLFDRPSQVLCIDSFQSSGRVLCRNAQKLYLIDVINNASISEYNMPFKSDLEEFLKMIVEKK